MHRTRGLAAPRFRAGEPRTRREPDRDMQFPSAVLLVTELHARHPPRVRQLQGGGEQRRGIHTPKLPDQHHHPPRPTHPHQTAKGPYSSSIKTAETSLDVGQAAGLDGNRGSADFSAEPRLPKVWSPVSSFRFGPWDGRSLTFRRSDRSIGGTVRRLGSSSARTRCSARSVTQGAASTLFWCRPCRHSLP